MSLVLMVLAIALASLHMLSLTDRLWGQYQADTFWVISDLIGGYAVILACTGDVARFRSYDPELNDRLAEMGPGGYTDSVREASHDFLQVSRNGIRIAGFVGSAHKNGYGGHSVYVGLPLWWIYVMLGLIAAWRLGVRRMQRWRRRMRRQCVECGYDLRGNTSGACPECGSKVNLRPTPYWSNLRGHH